MLADLQRVDVPSAENLNKQAASARRMADALATILNDVEYDVAAQELKAIKAKAKELEDRRKSITGPLDAAKKAVMDLFRGPMEALAGAEQTLKSGMLGYTQRREAEARAERERAEAAVRAERDRLEREARAAAAAAAAAPTEEEARAAAHRADLAMAESLVISSAAVIAEAPKAAGISERVIHEAEVIDVLALVRHIANERPDLISLLVVDRVRLRALARAMGGSMSLPGVEVQERRTIAARAA